MLCPICSRSASDSRTLATNCIRLGSNRVASCCPGVTMSPVSTCLSITTPFSGERTVAHSSVAWTSLMVSRTPCNSASADRTAVAAFSNSCREMARVSTRLVARLWSAFACSRRASPPWRPRRPAAAWPASRCRPGAPARPLPTPSVPPSGLPRRPAPAASSRCLSHALRGWTRPPIR